MKTSDIGFESNIVSLHNPFMHISEIWEGSGLMPVTFRVLLSPLSLLYAVGWECYIGVYRSGLKKAKHPHSPVFCVGNLIAGGSGKTPMTLHLVDVLRELGHEVVVSCSGYGSPKSKAATVAIDGQLNAQTWGDEAALFRWKRPNLPLIVGRARVEAAELCQRQFPNAVLLMDDGFQHLPLKKNLTILLDPDKPINRMCLPAGPYREPRWNRKRADLVIPGQFRTEEFVSFTNVAGETVNPPTTCATLLALAQPEKVIQSVEAMGCRVAERVLLPDHDPLTGGNLLNKLPTDKPTVVTGKDWVKLRNRPDVGEREFLILNHEVRVEPQVQFKNWLKSKLDGIQKANHSGPG